MAIKETEEKGIRVDPNFYSKLSNFHLNAKDWAGCGALAVLLYWWLCDKVTEAYDEDGVSIGVVMFGRPVPFATIADDKNLKSTWRAVQRNMEHLAKRGFIRRKRCLTTQGYSYEVVGCANEVLPEGTIRGKNGKTYTRKTAVAAPAAEVMQDICEICEKPLMHCLCNEKPTLSPAETFNKLTCPKCEVTSLMSQQAYDKHITICTAKPKAVPEPVVVKPVPPLPAPKPVEVPKVTCPMPHCGGLGTPEQVAKHKTKLEFACGSCKTAYHTKFERSACEDKCIMADKVKRAEEEEAAWAAMKPWERRAKWEKDKLYGARLGHSFGRWQEGVEFEG